MKYHKSIPFQVSPLFPSFTLLTDPISVSQLSTKKATMSSNSVPMKASLNLWVQLSLKVAPISLPAKGVYRVKLKVMLGEFEFSWSDHLQP